MTAFLLMLAAFLVLLVVAGIVAESYERRDARRRNARPKGWRW